MMLGGGYPKNMNFLCNCNAPAFQEAMSEEITMESDLFSPGSQSLQDTYNSFISEPIGESSQGRVGQSASESLVIGIV